jgi:hypothetical protein
MHLKKSAKLYPKWAESTGSYIAENNFQVHEIARCILLISILKCLKAKSYVLSLPGSVLVELPRPSALRKRLMYFPFEIII